MLQQVRHSLLEEARHSPNLLADLAGLETYAAESYSARSFVELLQNADDVGANRFTVLQSGRSLFVGNDGRPFSEDDFETLCRSAASKKHRGTTIGYRGIGFKSVVSFAKSIHLFSGELAASFSRERTKLDVPGASRVPLVRIPHVVEETDWLMFHGVVEDLQRQGITTVFVFSDLIAQAIASEFASFDYTSLLFLRSVRRMTIRGCEDFGDVDAIVTKDRRTTQEIRAKLEVNAKANHWVVLERNDVAMAFAVEAGSIARLSDDQAVVHAFLPTKESTGLGIKVNGEFSTDPSRTRIVVDDRTIECVRQVADGLLSLLETEIKGHASDYPKGLLAALIPNNDPRVIAFRKVSFETLLIQTLLERGKNRFSGIRIRPIWFKHGAEFETLADSSRLTCLPIDLESIDGLVPLMKSLGAAEAVLPDFSAGLTSLGVQIGGAVDVIHEVCSLHSTGRLKANEFDRSWRIWPTSDGIVNLRTLLSASNSLDERFVGMIQEREGTTSRFRILIEALSDVATADILLASWRRSERRDDTSTMHRAAGVVSKGMKLTKWRSAEQQVSEYLQAKGYQVRDVSRQNLGYDLVATPAGGETFCIEVKSIKTVGECFTMTSNEEAVAREKAEKYWLMIVHDAGSFLEISQIRDPSRCLRLIRQIRQWQWVCDEYPFEPEQIQLV